MTALVPAPPNWSSPYQVTYEFITEIIVSRTGKEQRRAMRATPRKSLTFDSLVYRSSLQSLNRFLKNNQAALTGLPELTRGVEIQASMAPFTATTLIEDVPAWLVDGAIVVLADGLTQEIRQVASISPRYGSGYGEAYGGIGEATITFAATTGTAWSAGALLCPLLVGRLGASLDSEMNANNTMTLSVTFAVDPGSESADIGTPDIVFGSREVLPTGPDWSQKVSLTFSHEVETIDYGHGLSTQFTPITFGAEILDFTATEMSRDDVDEVSQFFKRMAGCAGEFFVPLDSEDVQPLNPLAQWDNTLVIAGTDFHDAYIGSTIYKTMVVTHRNGWMLLREITALDSVGGNTRITFDTPWPVDLPLSDVQDVSLAPLCRFASDSLTVEWLTTEAAQLRLQTQTLEYFDPEDPISSGAESTEWLLSTFGVSLLGLVGDPLDRAINRDFPGSSALYGSYSGGSAAILDTILNVRYPAITESLA